MCLYKNQASGCITAILCSLNYVKFMDIPSMSLGLWCLHGMGILDTSIRVDMLITYNGQKSAI